MPLPGILGGFETLKKHFFFRFLELKNKRKKMKISKNIGKNREIEILVEIFDQSPLKTEISEIFFPRPVKQWDLPAIVTAFSLLISSIYGVDDSEVETLMDHGWWCISN